MAGIWSSIALASVAFVGALGGSAMADGAACDFQAGQEWSIASGNGAKVVIGRVEDWRDEKAVNVSITAINVPAGFPGAGTTTEIADVPFSCGALQGSVGTLLRTGVHLPQGFEDGYRQWREAKGGVFTISVNEVIALMLKSLSGN